MVPVLVGASPEVHVRELVHLLDVTAITTAPNVSGLAIESGRLGVPRALECMRHGNARGEEERRGIVRRLGAAACTRDARSGQLAAALRGRVQVEHQARHHRDGDAARCGRQAAAEQGLDMTKRRGGGRWMGVRKRQFRLELDPGPGLPGRDRRRTSRT